VAPVKPPLSSNRITSRVSGLRHLALASLLAIGPGLGIGVPHAAADLPVFWSLSGPAHIREGGMAEYTVSLSGIVTRPALSINWSTMPNTAIGDVDYATSSGSVTIQPTDTSAKFTVQTLEDNMWDDGKSFYVQLSSATAGTITGGQVETFIDDDDGLPQLAIQGVSVNEGDNGFVTALFNVTMSNASAVSVGVHYRTDDVTATGGKCGAAGVDYQTSFGKLLWAPGNNATQTIAVPVCGDKVYEGDNETFTVTLYGPLNQYEVIATPQATGVIEENDPPPPAVSVLDTQTFETNAGTHSATVPVILSGVTKQDVSFTFTTVDGDARAPSDYVATTGSMIIPAGATLGTIEVSVKGDKVTENNETFSVQISDVRNGTLGDSSAKVTIVNDD